MRTSAIAALAMVLASPAWALDVSEFQKMNDQLDAQFAKGDAAVISQMYSSDATVLPPGSDMVKGRENIAKLWKGAIDGMTDLRITTKEVLPLSGDAVREIGTFSAKTKGDNSQDIAGKFTVLWVREGGSWKINTDIWNMSK
jgi:ketosteroid isomerase-like protein